MQISFSRTVPVASGALAVFAAQDASLGARGRELDQSLGGALQRAIAASRFRGEVAEVLEILAPAGTGASRILIVGLGDLTKATLGTFERVGGALWTKLSASGETQLTVQPIVGDGGEVARSAARVAFGLLLRSYRFDRYRSRETEAKKPSLGRVTVQTEAPDAADAEFVRLGAIAGGVFLTRDLVSEPANILHPESFVERCRPLADMGVKIEALGQEELESLGFGAMLGVSQGSARPPRLLIMDYDGTGGLLSEPPVVLIGKGVTFDTGGISIKPAAGMEQMKWDMGGAGAVAGAIHALARRKARAHVIGLCGLVENMPSGTAQRPGDVVTSLSGQTVEVINTDAEGRLVLCDVMTYAQNRYNPKVMIDLATLTGAMIVTFGHEFGGIFSNDDELARGLVDAGFNTGDKLWRLPLGEAYDKLINSQIADIKNVGPREAGSITAAQFLKRFVKDGVAWAHLDIAGMVWAEKDGPLWEKGATGYGVRLLERYIADQHELK